jgi:hypothetical protein
MNKKDDKWLDELIGRTINTTKPEFDSEKWKQKYPDEFKTLQSRAAQQTAHSVRWISLLKNPIAKFAAAAVVILTIGFFVTRPAPDKKVEIVEVTNVAQSPAEMLTLKSLTIAYRNGGIEAVEKQCDKAIEKLGSKSKRIAVQELVADIDGV